MNAQPAVLSDEVITRALDRLQAALEALDAEATADCFAKDAELVQLQGTFHGRDAIRDFFAWSFSLAAQVSLREHGFGRHVASPFVFLEAVESLTLTDGTSYSVPLLAIGEFDSRGEITRWVRSSDRWSIAIEGARQTGGPLGVYSRWFLRQIDQSMTKGMPPPST